MVIVHNMVRYCRFMDYRLRRFTSGSCFYARGKFFCLNAMFLQTLAKLPTSFTNVGHRTVFTRDGVNNICGVKRVPLVFGMDKHISECTVRFHAARDIIGFESPGNPFRYSFHVRDSYHTSGFVAIRYVLPFFLRFRSFHLLFNSLKTPIRIATLIKSSLDVVYFLSFVLIFGDVTYQLSHVFDDLLKKSSGNFVAKQQSTSAVHRRSSLIH